VLRRIVCAFGLGLVLAASAVAGSPPPPVGGPAPDFSLTLLDGRTVTLRDYRGKPLLVSIWHSGCSHCQQEAPAMQAAYEKYRGRGVAFLGVNIGSDKEALARLFVEVYKLTYPVGRDTTNSLLKLYGVEATPTTLFIDKRGRLADRVVGEEEPAELHRRIEALLK